MHAPECQLHLPHLGMFSNSLESDQPPKVSASPLHLASSAAAAPLQLVVPPLVAPRLVVLLFHKIEFLVEVQALPTPTSELQAHPQSSAVLSVPSAFPLELRQSSCPRSRRPSHLGLSADAASSWLYYAVVARFGFITFGVMNGDVNNAPSCQQVFSSHKRSSVGIAMLRVSTAMSHMYSCR